MASAQNVIKNFMYVLDGTESSSTAALDEAVKSVSNFSSWSELINTMVKDCAAYNGDYDAFLKNQCNIILDNEDTGAIVGSDAGGGSTKTAESVVPESGSITYPSSNTFTIQGLNVTVPELSTLTDSQKFIVGALYTWWINSALTLINDSFGMNFNESGTTINSIDVTFYNNHDGRMAVCSYSTTQKCTELYLKINMYYYDEIDTSNENGVGSSAALTYLDRTIAHEMTHAVMAANVDWYNNLPTVFKEGSAELVHGIDDKRYTNIKNLASNSSSLKSAFSGSGTNTYAAGYMALRYLAKQAAENRDPSAEVTVTSSATEDTATSTSTTTTDSTTSPFTITSTTGGSATYSGNTLVVKGDFNEDIWLGDRDLIRNKYSSYTNVDATGIDATQLTGTIILAGNDNDMTISSGKNGGSVWGGAHGNDLLTGGASRDMFWYFTGCGNDTVQSFGSEDVITVLDGVSAINRSGNLINLTAADGSVLSVSLQSNDTSQSIQYSSNGVNVINAKVGNTDAENSFTYERNVFFIGGNAEDTINIYDSVGDTTLFITDNSMNVDVINAQSSSSSNVLAGNELSNRIYCGSGRTSLWGGAGSANDTLIGGEGENMFWYGIGEGEDVIDNANSADTINFYNVNVSDIAGLEDFQSGLKLKLSSGSLTINSAETPKVMLADGSSYGYDRSTASAYRIS